MGANLSYPEVNLSGKVALVTGGNTGIGYETAKAFARMGAHTFIGCRSQERAEQAIERMKQELSPKPAQRSSKDAEAAPGGKGVDEQERKADDKEKSAAATNDGANCKEGTEEVKKEGNTSTAEGEGEIVDAAEEGEDVRTKEKESKDVSGKQVKIEYLPLDLASFQSTKECVRLFKERDLPLHILVNNAAVAWMPFSLTGDGYETHLQVNHLGPMLLTLELLPLLISTAESCGDVRICFVSSKTTALAPNFNMEKFLVTREEDHSRLKTYPSTKLYNIMVGEALQRRLEDAAITVSSPEPGTVKTEIHRGFADNSVLSFLTEMVVYPVAGRSPADGAATSINCVVNPKLNSRQHFFYSDCKPARANREAYDKSKQEALWKKSIETMKDHLSPEVLDRYGAAIEESKPQVAGNAAVLVTSEGGEELTVSEQGEAKEVSSGEKTAQDSLPEEAIKDRAEEREVTPPGDKEEEPDKDPDTAATGEENERSAGTGNDETS